MAISSQVERDILEQLKSLFSLPAKTRKERSRGSKASYWGA